MRIEVRKYRVVCAETGMRGGMFQSIDLSSTNVVAPFVNRIFVR